MTKAQEGKRKFQFRLSEDEVNTYLRYSRVAKPRPGLDSMNVRFVSDNYVSTVTVIDFDMVEAARPGTVPMLLRPFLSGKKEVRIDVRIHASDGFGTFSVEKAYFEGVPLPAVLAETMINVLGARQVEKFDTSKPVPLPFGLERIVITERSMAGAN